MMYYYWRYGRIRPSQIYEMLAGEKLLLRAFYELEVEEKNKMAKEGLSCPLLF